MVVGAGFRWVNELHAVKGERGLGSIRLLVCLLSLVVWGAVRGLTRYHSGCAFFFLFFLRAGELVGYREECAPRKTSGLVARYDTRERGIHETFGKKNPCLPEPSIQIRKAPVLGYWTRTTVPGV